MKPVSPVIPGESFPETIIAKDQPEYMPLPVIAMAGGVILSRWEMDEAERKAVSISGELFVCLLTFGGKMPEISFQIDSPLACPVDTDSVFTVEPKTVYPGTDLPVLQAADEGVWLLLKLTDADRQTLSAKGSVYFFMHTDGKPVTPSLIQVEKPEIEAISVEFISCLRVTEKSENLAAANNIEVVREKCSICNHEVFLSVKLSETVKTKGLKTICSVCAEDSANGYCFLPETINEVREVIENSK